MTNRNAMGLWEAYVEMIKKVNKRSAKPLPQKQRFAKPPPFKKNTNAKTGETNENSNT